MSRQTVLQRSDTPSFALFFPPDAISPTTTVERIDSTSFKVTPNDRQGRPLLDKSIVASKDGKNAHDYLYNIICEDILIKILVIGAGASSESLAETTKRLEVLDDTDIELLGLSLPGQGPVYSPDTRGALLNRQARDMANGPLAPPLDWVRWMEDVKHEEYQQHKVLMHRFLEDRDSGPSDFESESKIDFSPLLRRRKNAPEICDLLQKRSDLPPPINAYTIEYKSETDNNGKITVPARSTNSDAQAVHNILKTGFRLPDYDGDFDLKFNDPNDPLGIYASHPENRELFKRLDLSEPAFRAAKRLQGKLYITPCDDEGNPRGVDQAVDAIRSDEQREIIAEQFRDSLADRYLPRPSFGMYGNESFLKLQRSAPTRGAALTHAREIAQDLKRDDEDEPWMVELFAYRPTVTVRRYGGPRGERKIFNELEQKKIPDDNDAYELKKYSTGWQILVGNAYRKVPKLSKENVSYLESLQPEANYDVYHKGYFDKIILATGGGDSIQRAGLNLDPADTSSHPNPYPLISSARITPKGNIVGILGTGLQAIDSTRELVEQGHKGKIDNLSRGGRMPAPRPPRDPNSGEVTLHATPALRPPRDPNSGEVTLLHATKEAIKKIPYPETPVPLNPYRKSAWSNLPLIVPPTHPAFRDNPRFRALSQGRTLLLVPNKDNTASVLVMHTPDDKQKVATLNLDPTIRNESTGFLEKRVYAFLRANDPIKSKQNPRSYSLRKHEDGTYTALSSMKKKKEGFPIIHTFPDAVKAIDDLAKERELESLAREWLPFPEASTVTLSRDPKKPYIAGRISPNDDSEPPQPKKDRQYYVNLLGNTNAATLFLDAQEAPILKHVTPLVFEELQAKGISKEDAQSRIRRMFSSDETGLQRLERQLDDIERNDPFYPTMLAIAAQLQRTVWKRMSSKEHDFAKKYTTIINSENAPMPLATAIAIYKLMTSLVEISEEAAKTDHAQKKVLDYLYPQYQATRYKLRKRADGDCAVTPVGGKRERIHLEKSVAPAADELFDKNPPQMAVYSGLKDVEQRSYKPPATYVLDEYDPLYNFFKEDLPRQDGVESIMLRHEVLPLGVHQLEVLQNGDPSGQNKKVYHSKLLYLSQHYREMYSMISERLCSVMELPPSALLLVVDPREVASELLRKIKQFKQNDTALLSPASDTHYLLKQGEKKVTFPKDSPLGDTVRDFLRVAVNFSDEKEEQYYDTIINATGPDPRKPRNFYSDPLLKNLEKAGFVTFTEYGIKTRAGMVLTKEGEPVKGLFCVGALAQDASPILSLANVHKQNLAIVKRMYGLKRESAERALGLLPYQNGIAELGILPAGDHSWDHYFAAPEPSVRAGASQPSASVPRIGAGFDFDSAPQPPPSEFFPSLQPENPDSRYDDLYNSPPPLQPAAGSSQPSASRPPAALPPPESPQKGKRKAEAALPDPQMPPPPSPGSARSPGTPSSYLRRSPRFPTTPPQLPQQGFSPQPSKHDRRSRGGRGG